MFHLSSYARNGLGVNKNLLLKTCCYLHAVGLKESPLCTRGEHKSVKHSFEHCEQYEDILEKLRSRLFFSIGKNEFSCKPFFEVIFSRR